MKSTSIRSHIRFPSRGAERRASLRPVRRRGVLSKLPGPQPVTKRCSRMRRVGALLQREELLHSGLSARADERNRSQGRRTRHQHGSLCSKPSAAMSMTREQPERGATSPRSPTWPHPPSTEGGDCVGAHGDSSSGVLAVRLHGRPEQRGTDLSQGRAHDRIVAAEIGRTASSSWKRAEPGDRRCERKRNAVGGNPGGAIVARPMEGAPDHQTRGGLHGTSRDGGLGRALAGSSSRKRKGGLLSRKRRGQAERGDGSVRG
jgi:hypothetical protein